MDDLWRGGDSRPGAAGFRIAERDCRGLRPQAACVVRAGQGARLHRRRSGALLQGRSDHARQAARHRRARQHASSEITEWILKKDLKVDDALALDVAGALRGFGLSIQKRSPATRAGAFGLLAAAAHQFDVTHGSVVAQMTGDGEVVDGANRDFLAHYSARAPPVVSLARQWLRTTTFFVSISPTRIRNQSRIKHHIEIAPSINLFDDLFRKNLHRRRRAGRTSNVTSSNGLSSS